MMGDDPRLCAEIFEDDPDGTRSAAGHRSGIRFGHPAAESLDDDFGRRAKLRIGAPLEYFHTFHGLPGKPLIDLGAQRVQRG